MRLSFLYRACFLLYVFFCLLLGTTIAQNLPRTPDTRASENNKPILLIDGKPAELSSLLINTKSSSTLSATPVQQIITAGIFTVDLSVTGTICRAGGVILAKASGGTPPYTYSLGINYPAFRNGWFPELGTGIHNLIITDATGHTETIVIDIPNTFELPNPVVGNLKNPTTCTGSDGSVTVSATGGTPPYSYSWDRVNFQSSPVFNDLTPGQYSFGVKDANGCVGASPTGIAWINVADHCDTRGFGGSYTYSSCNASGYIEMSASGNYPPFTYSLDQVNWQSSGNFYNLPPGLHKYYAKDSRGNISMYSIHMTEYCNPVVKVATTISDCEQNNGTATITFINGTAPVQYSIDGVNFTNSNIFTNLVPGKYRIGVKDANGLWGYNDFDITDNCPEFSVTIRDNICGLGKGIITANPHKGVPPYTWSIDGINFQSSNIFSNLDGNYYTITMKDATGRIFKVKDIMITDRCLNLAYLAASPNCGQNNGTIRIDVINGTGTAPFEYSIDGINFKSSNFFDNLPAGSYQVSARDKWGATVSTPVTLSVIAPPIISVQNIPATCITPTASARLSASSGVAPYQFSLDNTNWQSGQLFSGLQPQTTYTAYVKDDLGCVQQINFTTLQYCPGIKVTSAPEQCHRSNGAIKAIGNGGVPPLTYSLDNINYQTSNLFISLAAGDYTVYVKDMAGSVSSANITVASSCPAITLTVSDETCGRSNGSLQVTGSGGKAPYEFALDGINFQQVTGFDRLPAGNYTITIRDAYGVTTTTGATIQNIAAPILSQLTDPASCSNNDGKITITASGVAPFRYMIDNSTAQPSPIFDKQASGSHQVLVRDGNGCETSITAVVALVNDLSIDAGPDQRICEGKSVTLAATSNASQFRWSTDAEFQVSTQLRPSMKPAITTTYYIEASKGPCQVQDQVQVKVDPAPVAQADAPDVVCFGQDVQLTASGGVQYRWSPATWLSDPNIANPVARKPAQTTLYRLRVTDNNGCESLSDLIVKVEVTPAPKLDAGPDLLIARNQPWQLKAIDVNNSGFISYQWQPATGLNNPFIADPVARLSSTTTFRITARTAAGCEGVGKLTIKVNDGPEIYVPSAFTPNHDGKNDVLKAIPVGIKTFRYFAVFNRYGQRIFYSTNPEQGWNGALDIRDQGSNSFVWMAEGIGFNGETVQRKGTVLLVR